MKQPGSVTPNLDLAESKLAQLRPEAASVLLLRAGFLDLAILLRDIHKAIEDSNRLAVRMHRAANDQTSEEA
jgi:hypothetical protein